MTPKEFYTSLKAKSAHDPYVLEGAAFALRKHLPELEELLISLRQERAKVEPFPEFETITAIQVSIFDNWGSNKRPNKNKREKGARKERFKAAIEVWTCQPPRRGKFTLSNRNRAFYGIAPLMEPSVLAKKVEELRNPRKVSIPWKARDEHDADGIAYERFGDDLIALSEGSNSESFRLGPCYSIGKGTHFHLDTFAATRLADLENPEGELILLLSTPHGELKFLDWVRTTSQGAPLSNGVIRTCRLTDLDQKRHWATGPLNTPASEVE